MSLYEEGDITLLQTHHPRGGRGPKMKDNEWLKASSRRCNTVTRKTKTWDIHPSIHPNTLIGEGLTVVWADLMDWWQRHCASWHCLSTEITRQYASCYGPVNNWCSGDFHMGKGAHTFDHVGKCTRWKGIIPPVFWVITPLELCTIQPRSMFCSSLMLIFCL